MSQSDKDSYIEQMIMSLSTSEEDIRKLKCELRNTKDELEIEKSRRDLNLEQMLISLEARFQDKFNLLSQEYENLSAQKKAVDDTVTRLEEEKEGYKNLVKKLEKENKLLITTYISNKEQYLTVPQNKEQYLTVPQNKEQYLTFPSAPPESTDNVQHQYPPVLPGNVQHQYPPVLPGNAQHKYPPVFPGYAQHQYPPVFQQTNSLGAGYSTLINLE